MNELDNVSLSVPLSGQLEEIRADILALEKETEGLLSEVIGTDGNF